MKPIKTSSELETLRLGMKIGKAARAGDIVALCGGLGSGKTVLAKGIAAGLGVKRTKDVNSPSFVILKEHKGRLPLYHFDVYRLKGPSEFFTVDHRRYFYGGGICVIEWADRISGELPEDHLMVDIRIEGRNKRSVMLSPRGRQSRRLAAKIC